MHAEQVEIAVAKRFGYRRCIIVPNVSWGLNFGYELDMLIVSPTGYATEVEIKVTKSDLKADKNKRHQHDSIRIQKLYFAVPAILKDDALEIIPQKAGLIIVKANQEIHLPRNRIYEIGITAEIVKSSIINKDAGKLCEKELIKLGHLAAMRIWSLKERLYRKDF